MSYISVIVPIYDVEPYLRRCIDSILAQTYRDFDLILVDDGSHDHCGAICDEYAGLDPRIAVIHQCNGGLSAARNAGIDWSFANSTSKWLAFIDSDDFVLPEYLETLFSGATLGTDVVCVDIQKLNAGDEVSPAGDCTVRLIEAEDYWLTQDAQNSSWAKLFRKSCFAKIRYPIGKIHEDEYVIYRIVFASRQIAFCPGKLYIYCLRADSITGRGWNVKRLDSFGGITAQCRYFHDQGYARAFEYILNWLNMLCMKTLRIWPTLPFAKKMMVRRKLRSVKLSWIDSPNRFQAFLQLRNPWRVRYSAWISRVRNFYQRRGIFGGINYLLRKIWER